MFALVISVQIGCAATLAPRPGPAPAAERFQHSADVDPAVRAQAADELTGDPAAEAADRLLVLAERDTDPAVRAHALEAISNRRDPAFGGVLERAATVDPDPAVRQSAAQARDRLWRRTRDPHVAAAWGALCPGCGQFYLGNSAVGAAQLVASAGLLGAGIALTSDDSDVDIDHAARSVDSSVGFLLGGVGQDLWFYSIFDAYRTARVMTDDAGYSRPITRETLPELISAPFRPSVLAQPWVWAGVPLALGGAIGASYLVDQLHSNRTSDQLSSSGPSIFSVRDLNVLGHRFSSRAGAFASGEAYFAAILDPVGVGEEALFRGYLQTELEEQLGTYGGLATSSAIFGAIHTFNFVDPGHDLGDALFAVPVISAVGALFGAAYIRTGHRLETSVAMHFWYDFLLSSLSFAIDPQNQPFVIEFRSAI